MLESTSHAFIRALLDLKEYNRLMDVLKNKVVLELNICISNVYIRSESLVTDPMLTAFGTN